MGALLLRRDWGATSAAEESLGEGKRRFAGWYRNSRLVDKLGRLDSRPPLP